MANAHQGKVDFEAGGKTYTLCFSANALCDLEDISGKGVVAIFTEMEEWQNDPNKISLKFLRSVFCAALRDSHPDITPSEAGNLIIAAGGIIEAMLLVLKSVSVAFPKVDAKGSRPQKKRKNGTG